VSSAAIEIYGLNGHLVRRLSLGQREAGWHVSRDQAAYWDGHNSDGEQVSSGVYFYYLRAGDFSAQRKLVVAK